MNRLGLLVASVVAICAAFAQAAQAATWSVQTTPDPNGVAANYPDSVSCRAANACLAVGTYINTAGDDVTLSEAWNGSSWKLQSAPDPTGGTTIYLNGVSCSSADTCTAVGDYINGSGIRMTLAEVWNGASWKIESTPNPTGSKGSYLFGVSCSSASACTAAGSYYDSSGTVVTLAEVWNGSSWKVQTTPNPSGATESHLNGVSCSSASACTAVGYFRNSSSTDLTLAEVWNGTSWKVQTTAAPAGAQESLLNAVSCTAASACTAVGDYDNSGGTYVTLAEVWNGTSWTVQTPANPSGATESVLSAVSCAAAGACTAVGSYVNSEGTTVMLAEGLDGTTWTIETTPSPSGANGSGLGGVSCASAGACTAVGSYESSISVELSLAEAWNGSSWKVQSTPNEDRAVASQLNGVACRSASACTAVGYHYEASAATQISLAEAWNGTSWSIESTPTPTGATSSNLSAVSCVVAGTCTAVGNYFNSAREVVTLAEAWNGTSWTVQDTPNATGAANSYLDAVSCSVASACTAVGYYDNSGGTNVTLAEVWNGTSWKIQSTPNPTGAKGSYLYGVRCSSASACTAVGYYENSGGTNVTLAEVWNGTSWKVQSTPNPSGAKGSQLQGVWCTAASACTAVGWYENSSDTDLTLAEVWNGTSWKLQTTPNPSDSRGSQLEGVSCTAADACTAVGMWDNSSLGFAGVDVTLAEAWNGTSWTVQSTPNPSANAGSDLNGVSCFSASACTAAGTSNNGFIDLTLAERYS